MTIKNFILLSILVHVIILSGIYFVPVAKVRQQEEFLTRLVFPEEMERTETKNSPKKGERFKSPIPKPKKYIPSPVVPAEPRLTPPPEKAVVPGEVRDKDRPLKENLYPEPVRGNGKERGRTGQESLKPGYYEKDRLFDKEIIGDIAKKDSDSFDRDGERDNSVTFNTEEYRYVEYMRKLKERIENIWIYPPEAMDRGIYGDLKIRFTIIKNGRIGKIELVRTSGYKLLDDAAMKAIKDGEPYWPLPDDWGKNSYTILGHFIYSIYGFYVR